MRTKIEKLVLALGLFVGLTSLAYANHHEDATSALIKKAMSDSSRPAEEKARDANRKPVETLAFFGFKSDMKVVELIPGGGWYTRLLAPALSAKGKLYIAYGTGRVEENLLSKPGYDKVSVLAKEAKLYRPEGARNYVLENADLGVSGVDMVLTFRNYHNFAAEGRKAMNDAAFKALKKGGIYGVVDHTRRHMEADTDENRRRMDPVLAIKEIEDAGFKFVGFSDLHYQAVDKLNLEVGHEDVTGHTDRWTLKFIKK